MHSDFFTELSAFEESISVPLQTLVRVDIAAHKDLFLQKQSPRHLLVPCYLRHEFISCGQRRGAWPVRYAQFIVEINAQNFKKSPTSAKKQILAARTDAYFIVG